MEFVVKIILCVILRNVFAVELVWRYDVNSGDNELALTKKPESKEDILKRNILACTEETKVNPNDVSLIRNGSWSKALRTRPPLLKNWFLCLLVKYNIMSPDGVLHQDVVLANVPEYDREKVIDAIDRCLYQKKHSPVNTAWNYITCFRKKFMKYSII